MKISHVDVNQCPQPPLFPSPAVAITMQACIDADDQTVIFAVSSVDAITGTLNALWSSSPRPFDDCDKVRQEAYDQYLTLLWDRTGPFA